MANLWSILLAGGEGSRLAGVTVDSEGHHLPKQFCSLAPGPTLLGRALVRSAALVARERTLPVVLEAHRRWWAPELDDIPSDNITVQPRNCGTAPAILLALLKILDRDPDGRVVVLPTDHYVERESILCRTLRHTVETASDRLVLLGAAPRSADAQLGWIRPRGFADIHPTRIAAFVEKPNRSVAARLMNEGALVNTLILSGTAAGLIDLYRQVAPEALALLGGDPAKPRSPESRRLESAYESLDPVDFSRQMLEEAARRELLWVVTLPACGWTDLGTRERLESVRRRLDRAPLVVPPLPEAVSRRFDPDYWVG